jgi:hypothetical protein
MHCRRISAVFAAFMLFSCAVSAQIIGSANTVTADPPVARPNTTPCVVPLFTNVMFADFSPKPFSYSPSCHGPWAKVVFEADFSITAGRQFDRTANIWLGGANIYFGTTAEPSATVSRSWHVERDVTDYGALFTTAQAGEADLGNLVNATFTSVLFGSAALQFYPVAPGGQPPRAADAVLPLSAGPTGGAVILSNTASALSRTFTLPTNIERAFLDVYAQSQSNDEFWYTCVPNDVAAELQSCGATAFRETEITIDGQPAGVAPVYPWIYTGGIDPFLWRPIPGVQALNFKPYRVDLTPFASILSNGQNHQVALNVFNANNYFSVTASLLIFRDSGSTHVTGQLTRNTLGAAPSPVVKENLATAAGGVVNGTVSVRSSRDFTLAGFVNTSHGKVETEIRTKLDFSNVQRFDIAATKYVQNITQSTTIDSETSTNGRDAESELERHLEWPLTLDFSLMTNADNSSSQTTVIRQEYSGSERTSAQGARPYVTVFSNVVAPSDTLAFNAAGGFIGAQGQTSLQRYFTADSLGACYSRKITAANGVLTSVTDGQGCGKPLDDDGTVPVTDRKVEPAALGRL